MSEYSSPSRLRPGHGAGQTPPSVPEVIDRLLTLMEARGGFGYDTYDVRVGPLYAWLSRARTRSRPCDLLMRGLYALELAAPIPYRRLRGIPPTWDPMGNSYRAGAHLSLYCVEGDPLHLTKAQSILDEVLETAVGRSSARGFALGFPCVTGSGKVWATDVPVAHYSIRVARKLLIWERVTGDDRYAAMLDEVIRFLTEVLPWQEREGLLGVGYTPEDPLQVVNIWADVASLLACHGVWRRQETHKDKAVRLTHSVLAHQQPDGSWPYSARWEPSPDKVDNSHTAMVLGGLADVALCCPEQLRRQIVPVLAKGTDYWLAHFFEETTGKHWNLPGLEDHAYTVCLGDALYAFHRLTRPELELPSRMTSRLRGVADRVVAWSLRHLLLPDGHFCERRLPYRRYCLRSVRSFDGLVADSLSLYWTEQQVQRGDSLWTV